ncbi:MULTISPECIES: ABC transporter permease [unclassified Paenibacillus]|uniref:ABC transporter permease n=1 Tax=unclassified Paenibacillus TaxID=185978 RepID=UPI002F41F06F
MKFNDQFRFVRQNMKKNKTRLFMTVLATAMGCAFLIVLASVGFGLKQSIVDNIVGDRLVTEISIHGKVDKDQNFQGNQMTDSDIDYFKSLPNVKAVLYTNYVQQWLNPAVEGEAVNGGSFKQIDYEAEAKTGFKLSAGRMPETGKNEVIVGYHIRETVNEDGRTAGGDTVKSELLPAKDWLGKQMELEVTYYEQQKKQSQKMQVTIVGVAEAPSREWLKDKDIYIGLDTMGQIESLTKSQFGALPPQQEDGEPTKEELESVPQLGDERSYNGVRIIADHAKSVKALAETVREQGYYNHSIASELEQVNMMFMIMTIGLIFVGTIAVLIASIGIFNTMTMAVTERAQDIGIMKAIGAHPSAIRKVFLLESSMIGLLGAIVGTVVSYIISIAVNAGLPVLIQSLMNEKVPSNFQFSVIPPYLALLACVISLAVAMLSGYRPAKRATKIDVLRALRRDI